MVKGYTAEWTVFDESGKIWDAIMEDKEFIELLEKVKNMTQEAVIEDIKFANFRAFSDYQLYAVNTAIYPGQGLVEGLAYTALGLNGESGEVAENVKKILRDDTVITDERREKLFYELGDVLWYLANTCEEAGIDLEDVARANLLKLYDRKERNVLQGEGDNR
jgi:NTP pyrophosphatase (non-canonical NTP hydrolase)